MNMNVFIPTDNETVIVHSRGTFEGQFEAVVLGDYCNGTEDLLAIDLRGLRNVLENRRREHVPFALACFFVSGEVAVTHTHAHKRGASQQSLDARQTKCLFDPLLHTIRRLRVNQRTHHRLREDQSATRTSDEVVRRVARLGQ
jgi:hypothetical protein